MKKECRKCDKEFEDEGYEWHEEGFCSRLCHERWKSNYDDYVDPLGAYH